MKKLIVIDMQNDFITGSLGSLEARATVVNVAKKIDGYRNYCEDVIFTRDTHNEGYLETNEGKYLLVPHCIKGTDGWQICSLIPHVGCRIIDKPTFGFLGWREVLKISPEEEKNTELELVGLCTDICVVSNALILKAMYPEARITVDASCCAGATPESHKAALTTMKMCQIEVIGE